MALLKWQRRTLEELVKADLTIWENLARLEQFGEELHRVSTEEFLKGKCPDLQEPEEQKRCLKIYRLVKQTSWNTMWQKKDPTFEVLYWRATLQLSRYFFKDYLEYMEKNRPFEKKFWLPRRDTLGVVADDLQALEDGKYKFYGCSLPPRTGKSTLMLFFLSFIIGKRPNSHNAMAGHSGLLADGFYTEILNLTTTPEYTFSEIFPDCKLESKHADKNEVNYGAPDRFATMTCRGIDGTFTGSVDISPDGYLYVDDLVRDRTESLSPRRLEARYQDYLNVLVDRKNDGSREIMVGTRWNVMDPLGRVERQFKDDPAYLFRRIPALNDEGESNFAYRVKGFSTAYYLDIKNRLDKNEWMAKYQQTPFLREGLLYEEDSLRYFNGVKPEGDHRVLAACDVAWGGGDSLSMPIGYEYPNGDLYVVDWVFNKGTKEVTIPIVVGKIMSNQIRQICFEANNGGDMYCAKVSEELKMNKYTCSCTYRRAPGNMEKMQKMIAYSDDVKRRFIFLEPDKRSKEYQEAMDEFCMTVIIGKNEHDDAADGITQLAMASEGVGLAKVEAIDRLW